MDVDNRNQMTPYYADDSVMLYYGDALAVAKKLSAGVADCIVTSPPYFGLRNYGVEGQYGLESSPAEYVERLRVLFAELRRALAVDGTLWLNIGDSYAGTGYGNHDINGQKWKAEVGLDRRPTRQQQLKKACLAEGIGPKNLLGIPWRVAFALQDDGWTLRNAIIWNKPNAMPESVTDRLSGRYEHVFLFAKSRRYWFDLDAIREQGGGWDGKTWEERKAAGAALARKLNPDAPGYSRFATPAKGRNPGDVWTIHTQPFAAAHFAVMPVKLAQRCILAGCKPGGTVLDPFSGSGTTGLAAQRIGRRYVGIDLNAEYLDLSLKTRLAQSALDFEDTE